MKFTQNIKVINENKDTCSYCNEIASICRISLNNYMFLPSIQAELICNDCLVLIKSKMNNNPKIKMLDKLTKRA